MIVDIAQTLLFERVFWARLTFFHFFLLSFWWFASEDFCRCQLIFEAKSRVHELSEVFGSFGIAIEVYMAVGHVWIELSGADLRSKHLPCVDAYANFIYCLIQINIGIPRILEHQRNMVICGPSQRSQSLAICAVCLQQNYVAQGRVFKELFFGYKIVFCLHILPLPINIHGFNLKVEGIWPHTLVSVTWVEARGARWAIVSH